MIIKDCIVFLYDKEQKFIAQQVVKNFEKGYSDKYIVPIDDGAFINSLTEKNKNKIKNFMVKSNTFLYKMTERAAEKKINRLVKKQKKDVNKLVSPQLQITTEEHAEETTELIATNDQNDKNEKDLTKGQKLAFDKLTHIINVYHRFTPKMFVVMSKKAIPMLVKARELLKVKFDIVCVIPDFALDALYVNFETSKYLVVNDYVKDRLINYGISEDIIDVTGMVATEELSVGKNAEIKARLNIKNELPILVINAAEVKINYLFPFFKKIVPYSKKLNIFVYTGSRLKTTNFANYLVNIERTNKRLENVENGISAQKESDKNFTKVDFERGNIKFFSKENAILDDVTAIADILICTPDTLNIYYGICARIQTILVAPFTTFDKKNIAHAISQDLLIETVGLGGIEELLDRLLIDDDYKNIKNEMTKRIQKIEKVVLKNYIGGTDDKAHSNV